MIVQTCSTRYCVSGKRCDEEAVTAFFIKPTRGVRFACAVHAPGDRATFPGLRTEVSVAEAVALLVLTL